MPEGEPLTGRQLDAAVAERVMGACVHTSVYRPSAYMQATAEQRKGMVFDFTLYGCEKCALRSTNPFLEGGYPPYSSSMAAAWQVVEKLLADGFAIDLRSFFDGSGYRCMFHKLTVDERDLVADDRIGKAQAPTAPEAISRAAYQAMEHAIRHTPGG